MQKKEMPEVEGFILELYRNGFEKPCYVTTFDPSAEAGFDSYSEDKESAVVFESREALLPLASIEVEAITEDEDEEFSVYDGFRILPFKGTGYTQFIKIRELELVLDAFNELD